MHRLKSLVYKVLGKKNYLLFVSRLFFISYKLELFKKAQLRQHYFISTLLNPGDYVIDFGANLGYFSYIFSEAVGPDGKVFSVEPIPLYQEIFKSNCEGKKNIQLIPFALGEEEKMVKMSLPEGEIHRHGLMKVLSEGEKGGTLQYQVMMKDALEVFQNIAKLDYIKCDVEGFEKTILFRIKPIIERFKPTVQVEIKDNKDEILDFFKEMEYKVYYYNGNTLVETDGSDEAVFTEDVWFIHDN